MCGDSSSPFCSHGPARVVAAAAIRPDEAHFERGVLHELPAKPRHDLCVDPLLVRRHEDARVPVGIHAEETWSSWQRPSPSRR